MYREELERLERAGLLRKMECVESAQGSRVTKGDRPLLLMAGNNYLDLANHPEVRRAAMEGIDRFGVGAGASRLVSGTMRPHRQLEMRLARFKGTESALVFSTGYMANLGAVTSLLPKDGLVLMDRLCHASLIDGVRLSGLRFRTFSHRSAERLEALLRARPAGQPTLIVTEGVFSMEGDVAPLPDLLAVSRRYRSKILLDDAHGTGVMGKTGRGTMEHFGLDPSDPDIVQTATLGKALGGFGAFVSASRSITDFLANKSRTFIYTTALPPAVCSAAMAALDVVETEPERLRRLWENRHFLVRGLHSLGFETRESDTPIIPLSFPDVGTASAVSSALQDLGVWIPAIRPPTVPRGTSRLRITVMATHSREDLEFVLSAMEKVRDRLLTSNGPVPAQAAERTRKS